MTNEDLQAIRKIVEEAVTPVKLMIENEVSPAIDTLVEGQDLTHQMMKELAGKDEVEELRQEIRLLKSVAAAHSREIEDLKRA